MDEFARKPDTERYDIFTEAANRRGLQPIVIEKDFWVCWTLKRLFTDPQIAPYLTFKGGTSLSKAYGIIERFSEDIDLTINRETSPMAEGRSPAEAGISGKERARRIDSLKQNAQRFVEEIIFSSLTTSISEALGRREGWEIIIDPDDPDRQTIKFRYPKTTTGADYIKPQIKLEFGARGGTEPQNETTISPYVAQDFPKLFQQSTCSISTLSVVRSFWEKITILHALCHGSKMRDRMSRHYYDTFMMAQKEDIIEKALHDKGLLALVVQNKTLFFKDSRASYDTAKIGSLRLVPEGDILQALKKDYKAMEEMFMAEFPNFDEIIGCLAELESRLNRAD
ncbi:MAG: nucleotidyl transferase AbiEii/AbiGii toxin family protein [Desulfobulbus sp.]|nr:nucleotidyl transferase AbiEii/AbiGii toxin family protein [Desulfobulbus sp.]